MQDVFQKFGIEEYLRKAEQQKVRDFCEFQNRLQELSKRDRQKSSKAAAISYSQLLDECPEFQKNVHQSHLIVDNLRPLLAEIAHQLIQISKKNDLTQPKDFLGCIEIPRSLSLPVPILREFHKLKQSAFAGRHIIYDNKKMHEFDIQLKELIDKKGGMSETQFFESTRKIWETHITRVVVDNSCLPEFLYMLWVKISSVFFCF